MFVNIPELNQYFKHFNGKFGPLQKLHFVWLRWRKACRHFTGIVFAVVPDYQSLGVEAFMVAESAKVIQPDAFIPIMRCSGSGISIQRW